VFTMGLKTIAIERKSLRGIKVKLQATIKPNISILGVDRVK